MWTKEELEQKAEREGVTMSDLGSRGAAVAHGVDDWCSHGGTLVVHTPRWGWRIATKAEHQEFIKKGMSTCLS
jgi:hypothetical protein